MKQCNDLCSALMARQTAKVRCNLLFRVPRFFPFKTHSDFRLACENGLKRANGLLLLFGVFKKENDKRRLGPAIMASNLSVLLGAAAC